MTSETNRVLERVLEERLEAHRRASNWVHDDSEMEATGEVLLGELVSGDLRTIERCLDWVRNFEGSIPAVPSPGPGPRTWRLELDEAALSKMDPMHVEVIRAMNHLLFGGPAPLEDSAVWEDLSSLGLPPGLRDDIDRS